MTNNLKIEVLVSNIPEDGSIASQFPSQEYVNQQLAKKANLSPEGRLDPSHAPDYTEIPGLYEHIEDTKDAIETSIADSLQDAKGYTNQQLSMSLQTKADLVNGKIPFDQIPFSADIEEQIQINVENITAVVDQKVAQVVEQVNEAATAANAYIDTKVAENKAYIDNTIGNVIEDVTKIGVSKSLTIPTYLTPEAGVAAGTGVAAGAYFNVHSTEDDIALVEYRNVGGVPTPSGKSYLSALGVQQHEKSASTIKDESGLNQHELNSGVESIAELLAISNPKNGSRVYVKSYIAGLEKGGKDYVYQSSKSSVNDGGRCINGWVAQKETLDIFDFGATKYTGTDWAGVDYNLSTEAYYVSSSVYNNYKNYCDSVKQKGYFPNGDYVIQDGSYKLPKCGLHGDDKEGTRIFTALIQAGKIFEYNTLGVYSSGFANFIENLTIYTHRANKACFVMTVNTPTRGTKGDNVNFYSSGEITNYYDVWYLKWENCGFYGYIRSNESIPTDPYTAVAFVNKNNGEHNNTFYDKCSVLDVKHVFRGRKAGYSSSGVGLLFANCSFERIGECAFDLMYTNTTFLTCHFEQLGKHFGFKTPVTDYDRTILIYAGENTVSFVGSGNIWLGGNTPDSASYSIFNSEGRALIDLGSYRIAKNNRPLISMVGTYATGRYCSLRGGVVVNSEYSNTNPIDLHFSNVGQSYRQKSNQSQHLISDVEKASTTYQSVAHHPLITGSATSRSVCVVSARVYETPVLVRISGRVIRVGNTNKKCAQYLDIDASFLIEPSTPTNPQVINFNVLQRGVDNAGLPIAAGKSLFGAIDETALKALFTFKRLTAENTDSVSPFDVTYALVMSTAWIQVVADVGGVWQINDVKAEITFAQEPSKDSPHLSYIHNHNNVYI